jgi:hypothetical protein
LLKYKYNRKGTIMKFATLVMLSVVMAIGLPAYAQVPLHIEYDFSGAGNLMVSPVLYTGPIDAGEPLLVGGTWDISIDDTGWPGDADQNARWDYVAATYFVPNYNSFALTWTAVFNATTTASVPQWRAGRGDVGDLVGTAEVQMTIQDLNGDAVIQPDERGLVVLSGTIIVIKDGTGIWAGYCGLGSYSGFMQNFDPANYADDIVMAGSAVLDIEECSVPNEDFTWGHVKSVYSE